MSQVYTDDCFATGHQAVTDLQAFEDNFAALKSAFSGANAPANIVAGMAWLDTTLALLKTRNSANGAWNIILNVVAAGIASGDMFYASAANVLGCLAKGTAYQQLIMNSGATAPSWAASLQSLMTATGDIIVASAAHTPAVLAKGTALQVLRVNAAATGIEWVTTATGYAIASTERTTTSAGYAKLKEITVDKAGFIDTLFSLKGEGINDAYGEIYKNGAALGTERNLSGSTYISSGEGFYFAAGDAIQLYAKKGATGHPAYVKDFICQGAGLNFTVVTD